jgi:hypothetical protein
VLLTPPRIPRLRPAVAVLAFIVGAPGATHLEASPPCRGRSTANAALGFCGSMQFQDQCAPVTSVALPYSPVPGALNLQMQAQGTGL